MPREKRQRKDERSSNVLPKTMLEPERDARLYGPWTPFHELLFIGRRAEKFGECLARLRGVAESVSSDDAQAIKYAADLLHAIEWLEWIVRSKDQGDSKVVHAAAIAALDVGIARERLRCYLDAPAVVGRRKINQSLNSANRRTTPPEKREAALARFDELREAEPNRKLASIERPIEQEMHVVPRTLQSWLAKR